MLNKSNIYIKRYFAYEGLYAIFFIFTICLTYWAYLKLEKEIVELMMASFTIFLPFLMIAGIVMRRNQIASIKKGDFIILRNGIKAQVVEVKKDTFIVKSRKYEFETIKGSVFDKTSIK